MDDSFKCWACPPTNELDCSQEQTKNAQFIVVSLRENMFEIADQLVGIYKTQNCTKSITIIPRKYGEMAAATPVNVSWILCTFTEESAKEAGISCSISVIN